MLRQPFCWELYNKRDFKACKARKSAVYRGVNEHFEGEYNAKITLLDNFNLLLRREAHILGQGYGIVEPRGYGIGIDLNPADLRLQDVQNRRLPLTIGVGAD